MSMTTEQRLEWARQNLDRYLRECEVSEFLAELADMSHLEDRIYDLENATEDLNQQTDLIREEVAGIQDEMDKAAEVAS